MPYGTSIPYSVYGNTNIYINKTPGDAALHESTPAHTVHRSTGRGSQYAIPYCAKFWILCKVLESRAVPPVGQEVMAPARSTRTGSVSCEQVSTVRCAGGRDAVLIGIEASD